jgi:NAD(P)-dependent dehydrogenase (short-subunit alcohol dehydrogenase family)
MAIPSQKHRQFLPSLPPLPRPAEGRKIIMTLAEGKVAIVTGALSGIGEELSRGLVAKGWKVAGLDLAAQRPAVDELSKELGDQFSFIACDVSKYDELAAAFSKTYEKWDHIDAFCSNAGFVDRSSVYLLNRHGNTELVGHLRTMREAC